MRVWQTLEHSILVLSPHLAILFILPHEHFSSMFALQTPSSQLLVWHKAEQGWPQTLFGFPQTWLHKVGQFPSWHLAKHLWPHSNYFPHKFLQRAIRPHSITRVSRWHRHWVVTKALQRQSPEWHVCWHKCPHLILWLQGLAQPGATSWQAIIPWHLIPHGQYFSSTISQGSQAIPGWH